MFAKQIFNKEFVSRIYRGLLEHNNKKVIQILKMGKRNKYFSTRDIQMAK